MKPTIKALAKGGSVLAAGLLLTSSAVTGASLMSAATAAPPEHASPQENPGPPEHAGPPSWAPAPEHAGPPTSAPTQTPEPTEPTEDPGEQWRTVSSYNLTFDVPQDWEVVENCDYGCDENYSAFEVWDSEQNLAMNFETNSFRGTDNPNTYERDILDTAAASQLQYAPTSVVTYYWVASFGERDLSVAVIIDDEWQNWTEKPAIDCFMTSADRNPIMGMAPGYLQALGYDDDGVVTLDEATSFLESEQYATLKKVMTSVRETP